MPARTDTFDLSGLRLSSGAGRRLELDVAIDAIGLGGERYTVDPPVIALQLDVSRTNANGYALRLQFDATLTGPCMRCLESAAPTIGVESREVSQPGEVEDLVSPYLKGEVLDVRAWARDALLLSLPAQLVCRPDCAGLCPVCGADLNSAPDDHSHGAPTDPRWAKLSEIRFE